MKTIGLDLDGVLYDWHDIIYRDYKEKYPSSFNDFWTKIVPSMSKEEQSYMVSNPIAYTCTSPSNDTKDFLEWCNNNFVIYYITSRPESCILATEHYLRDWNFPQKENLFITDDKVSIARLYKIEYFVEDRDKQILALSKACKVIIRARPWNRHLWNDYKVGYSMMQIKEILEGMINGL